MSLFGPFSINGATGTGGFGGTTTPSFRTSMQVHATPTFSGASTVGSPSTTSSINDLLARLGAASNGVADAFRQFATTTKPVYSLSLVNRAAVAPSLHGFGARLNPIPGAQSSLQTTLKINTQTSTNRSSTSPLGLDLSSAAFKLDSSALGFDTTSPGAASFLQSSGGLGLDLTSPDAASWLRSAAALGLDLTSPAAASVLRSAAALGLDVSTPEAASRLFSAALGLDLTSPDAASTLSSQQTLGLDVTSAQRASELDSSAGLGLDTTSAQAASTLTSSATLGLDVTTPQSASTITSTAELNTAPTSYSSPSLTLSNATSVATLSGTFTGVNTAAGVTSLTVKMAAKATLDSTNATNVHFQVYDQNNTKLVDYSGSLKAGDKVYLGDDIGLFVSFSAGDVANNSGGTSAVSQSPASVDPSAVFNASDPNLRPQFDNGAQVTAGSFTINGTTINVNANDSINSVIARINSSAAGVTASFANDKLTIATSGNSEDSIYLANDTSGFLAATKLVAPNQEINSGTTSYGSNSLSFGLLSTSVATLSGTYTGVGAFANATSLTVKVQSANALNTTTATKLQFQVLDQGNHALFSFNANVKAGDKIALGNDSGLWISFSAGSVVANATASTTVSKTTKTDVDPTATFNNSDPNLRPRFENNAQVTAGSFTVNGTTVAVNANDSINSLLARINSTVSGVTATFANDRISIVNNSGSNPVVLANDTSGFLAATKLTAAVTSKGNVRDDLQVLSKTTQFAGVTNGSFTINGASISVNTATDSVSSIVSRINSSAAGVTAAYNSSLDKIVLTTNGNSEDLITVAGDTSGFATAAKLSTNNTVRGNIRDDQQVLAKTTQFASVATGSFTINGVSIAVNKDTDSVSSIVSRINASGAGVTASFDTSANKIKLLTTANSEDLITVGGDTSGFLTAAKLSTNNTVRGNIRDDQQVLAKTTQFGAVTTGSFTINGVSIAVNKDTDTLASIATRITNSAAGVTAAYDSAGDKLVLTGKTNSEDLITVGGDSTGFLAAARLATGNTVRGHLSEDTVAFSDLSRFSSVTNGSFVVGGKTIAVTTTDSIQSIVSKINGAGAGVTAAFDAATNKLSLTTTNNTEDTVSIGSDTSGFLVAAGVNPANTIRGNIRDDQQVLAKTSQFGAVTSGSFTINGVSIAVDKDTDTVASLAARITSSSAGVTASYDAASDKLVLTGKTNSEDLITVGSDTTGFLSAARLATGNTVRGHLPEDQVALNDLSGFQSVTDGSFLVDGKTIAVDVQTDTIQSLVTKINQSGARATASYDAVTDTIKLQATYNSEDQVPVGGDTSGFLAAAHLDAANTHLGNIRDDLQVLAKTSQFGTVTDGSFDVNGATVTVDAAHDSLATIVDKINNAGAGVTASLNASTNRIELTTTSNTEDPITVDHDTTGFLAAARLSTNNTVRGNIADDQQVLAKTTQFGGVSSGLFTVNGRTISVDRDADTVETLVAKINGANAGVTATYDAATDKLELAGPATTADQIAVGGDTTGFLAAAGLVSSNTTGKLADDQRVLSHTAAFAGVADGSFTVNGVSIAVNANTDTLQTVVDRINGSGAGVTASYDATNDRIAFTPDVAGATLAIGDDTSGFLSAGHVASGAAGTHVNANGAFDATGLDAPLFDPGVSVHQGSFTVNGISIAVAGNDTINSVLDRITNSTAGVTAAYDDATQTVTLTNKQQSATPVTVGGDTSGFLSAVKFDGTATSVIGRAPRAASDVAFGEMAEYAGVQAGTLTVNGHQIAIDPATTTLSGLVDTLNTFDDVNATIQPDTGAVTISSARAGTSLSVSDTSGLLSALGITAGTYAGTRRVSQLAQVQTGTTKVSNAKDVAAGVAASVDALNQTLSDLAGRGDVAPQLYTDIETAIRGAVDSLGTGGAKGLSVTGSGADVRVAVDSSALAGSLNSTTAGALTQLADDATASIGAVTPPAPAGPPTRQAVLNQIGLVARAQAQQSSNTLGLINSLVRPTSDALRAYSDNKSAGGSTIPSVSSTTGSAGTTSHDSSGSDPMYDSWLKQFLK